MARDVRSGLEVHYRARADWAILLPGGEPLRDISLPRKRTAIAARALLLDALPDWSTVRDSGYGLMLPDGADPDRITSLVSMLRTVGRRLGYGQCLHCGLDRAWCPLVTGRPTKPNGDIYAPDALGWAA